MRTLVILLLSILVFPQAASAYPVQYAEQFYKLFHTQLYRYPENYEENIWYLERALKSDFSNPLYALGRPVNDSTDWAKYRALFKMHVNLKIIEQYRGLAAKFNREKAYFFNAPWKEENLESLKIAEHFFRTALYYWPEARRWARNASTKPWDHYEGIETWEDERYRIMQGELDYGEIIRMDLEHLGRVRAEFEAMDENTY
ncbi:hypothetical protein [Marispirochaeta aestuarii]|uniref:hypothetical protein n=1 Tax=Marispirochaeta aestuarii TaxID=1963862 RepID=UPI0029C9A491|nr:hypothetical protein [Marispirochaeta aestuarii]